MPPRSTPRTPAALAPAPTAALVLLASAACSPEHPADAGRLVDVGVAVHDFLAAGEWEVAGPDPARPVEIAALNPGGIGRRRLIGRNALCAPPPSAVDLLVPAVAGPLRLEAFAGLDTGSGPAARVRFSVERDGAEAWHATLGELDPEDPRPWTPVGGTDGLAIAPGERLTLRTRLVEGEPHGELRPGWARLVVQRVEARHREPATAERPNVVLVVMDTLRLDRTTAHGYGRPTTPRLEELAARGLVYEQAAATSSWTLPSTASIVTGLLPEEHGVVKRVGSSLPTEAHTLAEAVRAEGYATACFSGNPLIAPWTRFDQGFEHFGPSPPRLYRTGEFLDEMRAWLDANREWRFFLYVQLLDPHDPYHPLEEHGARLAGEGPPELDRGAVRGYRRLLARAAIRGDAAPEEVVPPAHLEHLSDLYDACVATCDTYLGELLDHLEALGLADRTAVVVTSDHGEEFLDHGNLTHGTSLHPELTRALLVLAGPGIRPGRVEVPVSNRHLAPTLARLAGGALDVPDALDLLRPDALPARPVYTSTTRGRVAGRKAQLWAIRSGRFALHLARFEDDSEQVALYDRAADPGETRDVSSEHPAETARLLAALREQLALSRERALDAPAEPHPDAARAADALDALGYTGDD